MKPSLICTCLLCVFCTAHTVLAQKIENVKASVLGEKVVITYDITGASEGQKFKLQLFSSHNNFSASLSLVKGDIGMSNELLPGTNKRIEWDAKAELKDFEGEVTFEVKGEVISPQPVKPAEAAQLTLLSPTIGAKAKRGKSIDIRWTGEPGAHTVKLELMKNGVTSTQIVETPNSGRYTWTVPKTVSKGDDYQVRLIGKSKTVISPFFTISNKMSPLLIAVPALVVGGGAFILLKPDEDPPGPNPVENGLPSPPDPE